MRPVQVSPTLRSLLRRHTFEFGILAVALAVGCGPGGESTPPPNDQQALEAPPPTEGAPAPAQPGDALAFARANKDKIAKTLRIPSDTEIEIFSAEPVLDGLLDKIVVKTIKLPQKLPLFINTYLTRDRRHLLLGEIFEFGTPGRLRINPDWIPVEGSPMEGDPEAPVTILEFGDFECVFCAKQETALKRLLKDYAGKVRLVYKYFSMSNHYWATPALVAADCAYKQEPAAFFAFRDYFYLHQPEINTANVQSKALLFAAEKGLDLNKFSACYKENNDPGYGRESQFQGFSVSVDKIPTLFINGVRRQGVQSYEMLKILVNEELRAAGIEVPESPTEKVKAEAGPEEGASLPFEPKAGEEAGEAEGASPDEPEKEEAAETSGP